MKYIQNSLLLEQKMNTYHLGEIFSEVKKPHFTLQYYETDFFYLKAQKFKHLLMFLQNFTIIYYYFLIH